MPATRLGWSATTPSGTGGFSHCAGSDKSPLWPGMVTVPSSPTDCSSAVTTACGPPMHPAHRRQRGVHHQHVAGADAQRREVGPQRRRRGRRGSAVDGVALAHVGHGNRCPISRSAAAGGEGLSHPWRSLRAWLTIRCCTGSRPRCASGSPRRSPSPRRRRCRAGRPSAAGSTRLVCAPTGSGKTLTAFLSSIDRLVTPTGRAHRPQGPHPRALHLAAARPGVRRREEPALAAHGHPARRRAAGRAVRRAQRGDAHRRHQRQGPPGAVSAARSTCSSPRPRACTSCSPARCAARWSTSTRSSSTRSTPWPPPSAAPT